MPNGREQTPSPEYRRREKKRNETWTLGIAYLMFLGLGMTGGLLGVAWPSMRSQFRLPLNGVTLVYFVQAATYMLVSFLIGRMMARLGSGIALLCGMALMGLTLFGIALAPTWPTVVLFFLVYGFGCGAVDAGLNLYVAAYHTARQMNFLHAWFGIGITFGPLIMTSVLQRKLPWQTGYWLVAALLTLLLLPIALTLRFWRSEGFAADNRPAQRVPLHKTLRLPVVWFIMVTFLAFVSLEIGIGQWAYTVLTEARRVPPQIAGPW